MAILWLVLRSAWNACADAPAASDRMHMIFDIGATNFTKMKSPDGADTRQILPSIGTTQAFIA